MAASVTGLRRPLFAEILQHKAIRVGHRFNFDSWSEDSAIQMISHAPVADIEDVSMKAATSLKNGYTVRRQIVFPLQSSYSLAAVCDGLARRGAVRC
jgi:hypothetical protein